MLNKFFLLILFISSINLVDSQENFTEQSNESIINLNSESNSINEKVVYESKNELVKKYSIYAFALFLVFIIAILLLKE